MNWDIIENNLAIITAVVFWFFKDFATYFLEKIIHHKSKSGNKEYIKDRTKQFWSSLIHFPCELLAVSIGYLIGQIVILIQATSTADPLQLESIIVLLSSKIIQCCVCMFILTLLYSLLTDWADDMIQGLGCSKRTIFFGIVICLALYIFTIWLMLNFLSVSNALST